MEEEQNVQLDLLGHKVEEVLEREVKPYGNGAHVFIPKKHIGKDVVILVVKRA